MGFLDKAKDGLTKVVDQHGDAIKDGADKLARLADERTGGKHSDKIAKGKQKLEDTLDSLDGKNDEIR